MAAQREADDETENGEERGQEEDQHDRLPSIGRDLLVEVLDRLERSLDWWLVHVRGPARSAGPSGALAQPAVGGVAAVGRRHVGGASAGPAGGSGRPVAVRRLLRLTCGTCWASGSASKNCSALKPSGPGDEHVREGRDAGVVVEHGRVVVLAREADLVLGRGQLLLQAQDVLVGLQVRGSSRRPRTANGAFRSARSQRRPAGQGPWPPAATASARALVTFSSTDCSKPM